MTRNPSKSLIAGLCAARWGGLALLPLALFAFVGFLRATTPRD